MLTRIESQEKCFPDLCSEVIVRCWLESFSPPSIYKPNLTGCASQARWQPSPPISTGGFKLIQLIQQLIINFIHFARHPAVGCRASLDGDRELPVHPFTNKGDEIRIHRRTVFSAHGDCYLPPVICPV